MPFGPKGSREASVNENTCKAAVAQCVNSGERDAKTQEKLVMQKRRIYRSKRGRNYNIIRAQDKVEQKRKKLQYSRTGKLSDAEQEEITYVHCWAGFLAKLPLVA